VGFSETVRKWILLPATLKKIVGPVQTDYAMVETPMLLSPAGAAVTLLNWTGESIPRLNVKVQLPFVAKQIESVKSGPLVFTRRGRSVEFALPLGAGDIVTILPP
jgi:hypothetical protein